MEYKKEHIKEKFSLKPGKFLDQIGGNDLSLLRNPDRTNVYKMDIGLYPF